MDPHEESILDAAEDGSLGTLETLVRQRPVPQDVIDRALLRAIDLDVSQFLVEECDANIFVSDEERDGNTLLHDACYFENLELAMYLVRRGGRPTWEALNENDQTPLMLAENNEFFEQFFEFCRNIDVNESHGESGKTLLQSACSNATWETVEFLLNQDGININPRDSLGRTPIFDCFRLETLQLLLRRGADTSVRDNDGNTPLLAACATFHKFGQNAAKVKALLQAGADLNVVNDKGQSALHLSCKSGNEETGKLLLVEFGACATTRDGEGNTPLIIVCQHCGEGQYSKVQNEEGISIIRHVSSSTAIVQLLLGCPAENRINQPNEHGRTALCEAALRQNLTIVELLVDRGASVGEDMPGWTALEECVTHNEPQTLRDGEEDIFADSDSDQQAKEESEDDDEPGESKDRRMNKRERERRHLGIIFVLVQARVAQIGDVRSSWRRSKRKREQMGARCAPTNAHDPAKHGNGSARPLFVWFYSAA